MADPKKSIYARLASRFAHLALGASEEDEEEKKKAAGDDEAARAEDKEDEEKKGKNAKKGAAPHSEEKDEDEERADEEDGDGDEEARAEEEDEDEEDNDEKAKRKKALCVVKAYGEGRAFERARWAAVMSSPEAKGRVPLACSLLTDTKMSADKVRAALAASPAEARQGLAARMAAVPRPDVGSSASAAPDRSTPKGRAAEIVGAYKKVTGDR